MQRARSARELADAGLHGHSEGDRGAEEQLLKLDSPGELQNPTLTQQVVLCCPGAVPKLVLVSRESVSCIRRALSG